MKTAEQFYEDHKNDNYEQLVKIKNKLLLDIECILKGNVKLSGNIKPTLEEVYRNESEYLIEIEPLLEKKYIEEYINI